MGESIMVICIKLPVSQDLNSEYTYCLYCEKVFRTETWIRNHWQCPDDHGEIEDLQAMICNWEIVRKQNPEYPVIPREGQVYPFGDF